MSYTLPDEARIRCASEFTAALKGRQRQRGSFFVITAAPALSPEQACARLGLVVAKRYASRAVTRNALKRVTREVFRIKRQTLPPADYVVRLYTQVPALSLTTLKRVIRAELDTCFIRLSSKLGSKLDANLDAKLSSKSGSKLDSQLAPHSVPSSAANSVSHSASKISGPLPDPQQSFKSKPVHP